MCPSALNEFASNMAMSWGKGIVEPPEPPDVLDHSAVSFQLPALPIQYLVTGVVAVTDVLPPKSPTALPVIVAPVEVISLKFTLSTSIVGEPPAKAKALAVPRTLDITLVGAVCEAPCRVKVPPLAIVGEAANDNVSPNPFVKLNVV